VPLEPAINPASAAEASSLSSHTDPLAPILKTRKNGLQPLRKFFSRLAHLCDGQMPSGLPGFGDSVPIWP